MTTTDKTCCSITAGHLLIPVSLVSFTLVLMLGFQTVQILRERDNLHEIRGQQNKPVEDSQRVQAQLTALATGTQKLADQGNANAKVVIEKLKEIGVTVAPPNAQAGAPQAGGLPRGSQGAPPAVPGMAPPVPTAPQAPAEEEQ